MDAENSAVRAMRRSADAVVAQDMTDYADSLAEEILYEDRRKGLQSSLQKREQIEQARVMAELGLERYDLEVLETRGDRTALCRETWHVADFEIAILLVGRVDDEGRGVVAVMFDDKDLDAARAELDAQGVQP